MAGYWLGLSLHYLTDLTRPMHAGNFTYLDSYFIGYHTGFESYALEVQADVTPHPLMSHPVSAPIPSPT